MNNEMQLRYLYFLTLAYSGKKEWEAIYSAWNNFGNFLGTEEYSELMDKVREFHKKYKINKKS